MKKILFIFALTASMMMANAQVKELEPASISEIMTAMEVGKAYDGEDEFDDEDGEGYDGPQSCYPVTKISATSRLAPKGMINYEERNLYDEDFWTSWVEGVQGYGIGEKVTFTLNDVTAGFTGIVIANGDYASESSWENYSRVKKLKVYFNGEPVFILNLKNEMGNQSFSWDDVLNEKNDQLITSFTVTIEILDVYKGDLFDETVISEVQFLGCH